MDRHWEALYLAAKKALNPRAVLKISGCNRLLSAAPAVFCVPLSFVLPNSYAVTRYRMTATIVEVSPINASKGINFMRFLMSM